MGQNQTKELTQEEREEKEEKEKIEKAAQAAIAEATESPIAKYRPDIGNLSETYFHHYKGSKEVRDAKTQKDLILREIVLNTKEAFETEVKLLYKKSNFKHPNIATIVGYNTEAHNSFCSDHYKIQIFIEKIEKTLKKELNDHIKAGLSYKEKELLLVAENLISALSYFQSNGLIHGDIRPKNIFVQDNTYKLSYRSINSSEIQHGLHNAIVKHQKTFLAPELLAQVPNHDFEIRTDKFKADVFSLGVTLLSLATLSKGKDIYDYKKGKINENSLNEKLDILKKKYSLWTNDFIRSMLSISEVNRPDFIYLSNIISPFQKEIRGAVNLAYDSNKTETVKRSALPEQTTTYKNANVNSGAEDNEARKAALNRGPTLSNSAIRDAQSQVGVNSSTTGYNNNLTNTYFASNYSYGASGLNGTSYPAANGTYNYSSSSTTGGYPVTNGNYGLTGIINSTKGYGVLP